MNQISANALEDFGRDGTANVSLSTHFLLDFSKAVSQRLGRPYRELVLRRRSSKNGNQVEDDTNMSVSEEEARQELATHFGSAVTDHPEVMAECEIYLEGEISNRGLFGLG